MKKVLNVIGFIASLYVWVSFAYFTLDRSAEAQQLTGGGYLPHKASFFILAGIMLLFFRKQIITKKISVGNVISKVIFALILLLAFLILFTT